MEVSKDNKAFFVCQHKAAILLRRMLSFDKRQAKAGRRLYARGYMSITIMSLVWKSDSTKASERLVLLALADMANDDGFCWPGFDHLARKCNLSRRFIIRIINALEAKGLIQKDKRFDTRGDQTSNMYRVMVGVNHSSLPQGEQEDTTLVNHSSPKSSLNQKIKKHHKGAVDALHPTSTTCDPFVQWFKDKRQHPAIQAIKQVTGRYPTRSKAVYEQLIEWLGDNPNIQLLEWAYGEWVEGKAGNPMKTLVWVKEGYVREFHYEIENYLPLPSMV